MHPNHYDNTYIDSNDSYQNFICKIIIQGHGTSTSKCTEVPCYTYYTRYICQSLFFGIRGNHNNNFLATITFSFLCSMYPTCNLAIPQVCNLGGFLLSIGIHDRMLYNLGHLNKCVDGHDHGRLGSLGFANHVKFFDQLLCYID